MAFTPITKDDVYDKVRDLDKTDPARDNANVVDIIISIYNCLGELQDSVGGMVQPLPDILKP